MARPNRHQGTELERAPVIPSALNQPGAAASLPVPAYNWVFGCSAVSASMIGAYFDRNGLPNIYTGPGTAASCRWITAPSGEHGRDGD